jgi:hypothetical protein
MIEFIIPLVVIYLIYIYNKPLFIIDNNNYIKYILEKNLLIFLISIISLTIIWQLNINNYIISYTFLIILINLILWIKIFKYKNYENELNEIIEIENSINNENFISSISKSRNYSYTNKKYEQDFTKDFLNECYNNKLLTDFKPIIKLDDIKQQESIIRETTLDLALNSDNMFSIQNKENKCIIANYIPDNLALINNNSIHF